MPSGRSASWIVRVLVLVALSLVTSLAAAAGRVQWGKTTVKETDSKAWKLEVKIYMTKAPDVAHVPMKFEFEPLAYYERTLVDGKDGPQDRRVPLTGREEIIEGVEVGFMDPGTGKTAKGTAFTFKVTRSHGFEAGEYKVTIRDARNGQVVGSPTTLKFEGENDVIDRRTMTFADPGSKKKKKDGDGDSADSEKKESPSESSEDNPDTPSAAPDVEKSEEVKQKPGGCGCRVAGDSRAFDPALVPFGLGLLAFSLRRRRSRNTRCRT